MHTVLSAVLRRKDLSLLVISVMDCSYEGNHHTVLYSINLNGKHVEEVIQKPFCNQIVTKVSIKSFAVAILFEEFRKKEGEWR